MSEVPNVSGGRESCIDNLLVRIHFIIVMIRWTGLASVAIEVAHNGLWTRSPEVGPPRSIVAEKKGRTTEELEEDQWHVRECVCVCMCVCV